MAYRYRDIRTGRFSSKKKWQKSKVSDGGNYRREVVAGRELPEIDELLPEPDFDAEGDMVVDGIDLLPTIDDIDDWMAAYNEADDYYTEDYEGGVDTGRKE